MLEVSLSLDDKGVDPFSLTDEKRLLIITSLLTEKEMRRLFVGEQSKGVALSLTGEKHKTETKACKAIFEHWNDVRNQLKTKKG